MGRAKSQADLVQEKVMEEGVETETTEKVKFPGLATLHEQTRDEMAEVFVMILKSRANVIAFRFEVGSPHVELTYRNSTLK